jgi:hypothetical protein
MLKISFVGFNLEHQDPREIKPIKQFTLFVAKWQLLFLFFMLCELFPKSSLIKVKEYGTPVLIFESMLAPRTEGRRCSQRRGRCRAPDAAK